MGSCSSIKNSVEVQYHSKVLSFSFKNLIDLRMQIMKSFNIDDKFILQAKDKIIKSSNELIILSRSSKRPPRVLVSPCDDTLSSNKSQVSIGKSFSVLVLNKYLIFPEWLFSESTIESHSITIQNEEYPLKNYYLTLDVASLAIGKIKKSGRKVNSLFDLDKDLEHIERLFVLKDGKKIPALSINNQKHMTCSLVYNDQHSPVGILSWDGKNILTSLNTLKSSIHFAIHFTTLPNESMPGAMSNLHILNINHIYTEYGTYFKSNKLITYSPNDYEVQYHNIEKNLENYSITQTPFGYIFALGFDVIKYNLSTLHVLPRPSYSHTAHSCTFHAFDYILISGSDTYKVESLNMHSLKWTALPDFPVVIENAACCSHITSIYVIGGKVAQMPTDSVYKLDDNSYQWVKLDWTLPWSVTSASAFAIGKEILVFGGVQSDKDKFVVFDNGKEVVSGFLGNHGNFEGLHMGKVNMTGVCFSRQGQIFKYDHSIKKFFMMSIGNYNNNN